MSEGIRGSRPPPPQAPAAGTRPSAAVQASEVAEAKLAEGAQAGAPEAALDLFEASQVGRPQAKQELQGLVRERALTLIKFSDQELAKLAGQLVGVFKRHPKASSRSARAKLATHTILRGASGGPLGKIIDKLDPQEAEDMENDIAAMLADSPRLGEWLDRISEEASRP